MSDPRPAPPRAPAGLGSRGRRLWSETAAEFTLRRDELTTLEELCRTADGLDRMETELRDAPLLMPGSAGQLRPHPLLGELRGARAVFAQLSRLLGLSDVPESEDDTGSPPPTPRQVRARRAAEARWSRSTGRNRGT